MQTLRLDGNNPQDVALAGEILRRGGVVAIPTETVYGLAANALDAGAAARIFAAKGRPADNPLIVHISSLQMLGQVCRDIPPQALTLAEAFWPGPLSLVLPRGAQVPDTVTGGLDTVGVRMPAHPVALAVIQAAQVPLAAPSANLSGRPSATCAAHVLADFDGRIDAVVDGGPCAVGVESSVVSLLDTTPVVLRPGAVQESDIAAILGAASTAASHAPEGAAPLSPGMKYTHYATRAPITLFVGAPEDTARALLQYPAPPGTAVIAFEEHLPLLAGRYAAAYDFGPSWDHASHARRLFDLLRRADGDSPADGDDAATGEGSPPAIYVQCPRVYGRGAATYNRLSRACGGREIACTGPAILGVTGRSGAGKSVLSAHLRDCGATVLDADQIYAGLLRESTAMQAAILARFPRAEAAEGGIDRRALGRLVFGDPQALLELNAITHPHVAAAFMQALADAREGLFVLDVPVLFGNGIDRLCTVTVGLLAREEAALARIMARDDIGPEAARRRLEAQQDDGFFRARCDIILENYGDRPQFIAQVDTLIARLGLIKE